MIFSEKVDLSITKQSQVKKRIEISEYYELPTIMHNVVRQILKPFEFR